MVFAALLLTNNAPEDAIIIAEGALPVATPLPLVDKTPEERSILKPVTRESP
jgi:hypothetical protein